MEATESQMFRLAKDISKGEGLELAARVGVDIDRELQFKYEKALDNLQKAKIDYFHSLAEAATGKKFVNYWVHGAFLTSKGEKISKSKGGLYTISELEEKGFSPLNFRYLCLATHYRKPLNFSIEKLKSAQTSYQRLKNIIAETKDKDINKKYLKEFEKAINNDLDMPGALQVLWKLLRDKKAKGKLGTIKKIDEVFGLDLDKEEKIKIPMAVKRLIAEREKMRKKKDWKKADELRKKINKLGYAIDDTEKGSVVRNLK